MSLDILCFVWEVWPGGYQILSFLYNILYPLALRKMVFAEHWSAMDYYQTPALAIFSYFFVSQYSQSQLHIEFGVYVWEPKRFNSCFSSTKLVFELHTFFWSQLCSNSSYSKATLLSLLVYFPIEYPNIIEDLGWNTWMGCPSCPRYWISILIISIMCIEWILIVSMTYNNT